MHAKSLQSCLILCDPMDYSPLGSSVHGILWGRILEWVAVPSSLGSSQPRDQTCLSYISCIGRQILYHWHHLESPKGSDSRVFCFAGHMPLLQILCHWGMEAAMENTEMNMRGCTPVTFRKRVVGWIWPKAVVS